MIIRIDTTSSTPVYAQIVDQIKRAIASGAIRSGDSLPSLRETAIKLRVNPLTVSKAYKQIEHEGLIETRHGLGSFVTADREASSREFRRETLAREVDNVLVDAWHLGVTFDELREIFEERAEAANNGLAQHDIERSNDDEQ
ncbi:MAG: GntR family transcriptional regulator [Armatimonadota bacterium]|nr:GntR family transcriptional regulator [Armatimonadota bacterium]